MLRRCLAAVVMMISMAVTGILIRFVCLTALMEGTAYGLNRVSGESGDANIGAGLMAFLVVLSASGAWGFADGRKGQAVARLLVSWLVIAVLVGVASVIFTGIQEPGYDLEVLRSDLVNVSTFIGGLVMIPAAMGVLLGALGARKAS